MSLPDPSGMNSDGFYICYLYNRVGVLDVIEFRSAITNEEKVLPLEAVAEQVISNAEAGSLDAQVATNIATNTFLMMRKRLNLLFRSWRIMLMIGVVSTTLIKMEKQV